MDSYCVFCATGREKSAVEQINNCFSNDTLKAILPRKIVRQKRKKRIERLETIIIPGYAFIYSDKYEEISNIKKIKGIYKLLTYGDGSQKLIGSDAAYAMWVYNNRGLIDISEVIVVGSIVEVVSGPLTECMGKIIWVDRKKSKALIAFDFNGRVRNILLEVNILKHIPNSQNVKI